MGKRWTNVLGFVQLIAKNTMEQPMINQIDMKNINTLTPYNKVLPTTKENELNFPFIRGFFPSLFFHFFSNFAFSILFWF